MNEFLNALGWFVYGFMLGWIANPLWRLLTKIVQEAKIARNEWHKGPRS